MFVGRAIMGEGGTTTATSGQRFIATTAEEKLCLRLRQLAKSGQFQIIVITVNPLCLRSYSQIERLDGASIRVKQEADNAVQQTENRERQVGSH